MSPVYTIGAYPRELTLRDDGPSVLVRPLEREDERTLLDFFLRLPEEDRFFLKDDVTSPAVIRGWVEHLNYDRALPLVACGDDGRIVAEAVLVRRRGNARSHVGEVRVTVDPEWRNRGLGTALIRELCDIANDAELDAVLLELVEGCEHSALEAAEAIGFVRAGRIEGGARDQQGRLHDLVTLSMPLGKYYEWSKY
jgi:L-amino acid N-acyltransferase YncA